MSKSINPGENNGQSKLTMEAVQIIRHLLRCGHSGKEIATVYGLSSGLISGIRTGKLWSAPEEELVDKNKFKGRPFRDEDIQIITEEVTYLIEQGYRAQDRDRILEGLEVALDGSTKDEWRLWTGMKLRNVIDDFYILGAP